MGDKLIGLKLTKKNTINLIIGLVENTFYSSKFIIGLMACNLFVFISCANEKKQMVFMDTSPKPVFEQIAESITKNLKPNIKRSIVMTFITQDGKEHSYGALFAEKLTTDLVKQNKLIVLDRLMFKGKLSEKSLSLNPTSDLNYVKQIGDLLNVDAVVIGIVTPYASGYDINCRLIDVKTGLILSAEEGYYSEKTD
jgi:TolB-like protein